MTLAAGDVVVYKNGVLDGNIDTLPVEIGTTGILALALSATEMTADTVVVRFRDQAGAEWADCVLTIHTVARNFDDLAYPTTPGRSLDVTATGAAGVDWSNVENPTTTVGLSGTTVKTVTDVETDTADIQARLPAALTSGRINANVGAVEANVINDAAVAADVTIASVIGAVGSVAGNVGGNVVGSVASVTAGVTVTTNNDKAGYALSAAAVQAIWDALTSALTTVGSIGKRIADNLDAAVTSRMATFTYTAPPTVVAIRTEMDSNSTQLAAIVADTNELQTDLTNGGRLDLLIDAILADTNELQTDWTNGGRLDLLIDTLITNAAAILADTGTDGVVISTATRQAIADEFLGRSVANVEATAGVYTLASLVLAAFESAIAGTVWTIKRTDGTTTFATRTVATDAAADPIVSVT